MISQTFESKRPLPRYHIFAGQHSHQSKTFSSGRAPDQQDSARANAIGITPAEFVRRDDLIRRAYTLNTHAVGDIVIPVDAKDYKEYGDLRVRGILKTYYDISLADKDWDAKDTIFLLSLEKVDKPSEVVNCTASWCKKKP